VGAKDKRLQSERETEAGGIVAKGHAR